MKETGIRTQVIQEICKLAQRHQIQKVILFGSRARGDYHRTSDIDLAISGGNIAGFCLDVEEETTTLLQYDLVNLDGSVQEALRQSIEKEGVVLYEKYENFCAALKNLAEVYQYEEPYDTVTLTGLVGLYEICFEQAWKMMKEILENHGFAESATGSPKLILKTAYRAGMIVDEDLWLEGLQARNNVSHAYNQAVALDIIIQTKEKFYNMFCQLKDTIDESW